MASYNLTAEEVLLIQLTFMARDEEGSHSQYFNKWFENGGYLRLRELFNSLKEKGVILKNYNPDTYAPNEIEFNSRFIKSWLKSSNQLGQELLQIYPPYLIIGNEMVPLKNISKRFASWEELFFFYGKQIAFNPETHNKILELVQWGKDNGFLKVGISEFVISHYWDLLQTLKDQNLSKDFAASIDINESV